MRRAILCAAVMGLAVGAAAAPAQAEEWRPITRACSAKIGEQGGHWPEWAKCTIARAFPHTDPARVRRCIRKVAEIRKALDECNLCGDPVKSVIDCATGGRP